MPVNERSAHQTQCNCKEISRDEGHDLLVTFERVDSRVSEKGNDTIWFRLRNRSGCSIYLPTDHEYGSVSETGQLNFEIQDGAAAFLKYQVKKTVLGRSRKPAASHRWVSYMGGTTYATPLPPGTSVLFYVPIANLKRASHLAVLYQCRKASRFGSKAPRVFFNLETLPDSALQTR
jgi:hypothetical protein